MLTDRHRRERLAYAQEHVNWTLRQWQQVLFSDESRFRIENNDSRIRVWRRPGEAFDKNCVHPRKAFNGGSIMVWAGVSWNHRTDLVVVPPPGLNSQRYVDEILTPHVLPVCGRRRNKLIFMQDNARAHTADNTRAKSYTRIESPSL